MKRRLKLWWSFQALALAALVAPETTMRAFKEIAMEAAKDELQKQAAKNAASAH